MPVQVNGVSSLDTKSASGYDAIKLQIFHAPYVLLPTNDTLANAAETALTEPATVTPNFPTDASLWGARIFASLVAVNQTATEHTIKVTLQKNVDAGGWEDAGFETTHDILALSAVQYESAKVEVVQSITPVSGESLTFRWQVDSSDAAEVHYLSSFRLVVSYDFSAT